MGGPREWEADCAIKIAKMQICSYRYNLRNDSQWAKAVVGARARDLYKLGEPFSPWSSFQQSISQTIP